MLTATISSRTVTPREARTLRRCSAWSVRRECGRYRTGPDGARHVPERDMTRLRGLARGGPGSLTAPWVTRACGPRVFRPGLAARERVGACTRVWTARRRAATIAAVW